MKRFVAFWARTEDPLPLAMVRIGTGLATAFMMAEMWEPDVMACLWGEPPVGYAQPRARMWLMDWVGTSWPVVQALSVLTSVSAIALILGIGSRVAAAVALVCFHGLYRMNMGMTGGHDWLLTNALWLMVLAPAGRTWSVDCWLRTKRWVDRTPVPAFARYLIVWQMALLYWTAGVQKVGAEWMPWGGFSALYEVLWLPTWGRYDLTGVLGHVYPLLQVGTAGTMLFEWTFPIVWFALLASLSPHTDGLWGWKRRLRRLPVRLAYAAIGWSMHIGLLVLTDVGPFSQVSMALYPALFSADELHRGAARVRALATRSAAAPAAG